MRAVDRYRRIRRQRLLLMAVVLGGLWAWRWLDRVTLREYMERNPPPQPTDRGSKRILTWEDMMQILPPIDEKTLASLPRPAEATEGGDRALERCFSQLAKASPWGAQSHCEEAVLKSPKDARAYMGRGYANLVRGSTRPPVSDFQKACALGMSGACQWIERLPNE